MASNAANDETHIGIATIAEAVMKQFGTQAIAVATNQATIAIGNDAIRWHKIVEYIDLTLKGRPKNASE